MQAGMYERFERSLFISILLISFIPFLFVNALIYKEYSTVYRNRIEEQITYRARVESSKIDSFLEERVAILSSLADLHTMDELMANNKLAEIFKVMNERAGGFVDVGIINDKGNHIAYLGPYDLEVVNYYNEPWFAEVMTKGVFISDVFMGYRRIPHFIIAVRRRENSHYWIMRATIDSNVFNLLVREAKLGQTGDAFLINREGLYQTHPRFGTEILSDSGLDLRRFGHATVMETATPDGRRILCAGNWLKNKEWLLVIAQDPREEISGLLKTRAYQLIFVFIGSAAIIIISLFIAKFSVDRLKKLFLRTGELNAHILHEDKMAALGKMAAGIAHEINNPLAIINENAGLMQDMLNENTFRNAQDLEEYRAALQKVVLHVERARKIIFSMLSYSRKMEPRLETININDVIEQTIEFIETEIQNKNISVQTDFDPQLPLIHSDQAKLQQVFLNLLNNAIEAAGENGLIKITTLLKDSQIVINVTDNGPGIPQNLLKRVFEPFFTTKGREKGTGLGLWISYSILKSMGGDITIASKEEEETTFCVQLPFEEEAEETRPL